MFQLLLCDHTAVQEEDGMVKSCTEVFQPLFVFATPLAPTLSSSPPPPSLPVISVRDAVYEYETVGTLHSQTHADTQDTAEHQTRRLRHRIVKNFITFVKTSIIEDLTTLCIS